MERSFKLHLTTDLDAIAIVRAIVRVIVRF